MQLANSMLMSVECRVSDQKVVDSRFDSRTGNASLCPWERPLTESNKSSKTREITKILRIYCNLVLERLKLKLAKMFCNFKNQIFSDTSMSYQ